MFSNKKLVVLFFMLLTTVAMAQRPPPLPRQPDDGSGSHNPPLPRQPKEPDAPATQREDIARVKQVAREQANMLANRVVKIYGDAERALYNYYLGLLEGVAEYMDRPGGYQRHADYVLSQSRGDDEGLRSGENAGLTAAQSDGDSTGRQYAAQRFTSVVDQNINPDTRVPATGAPQKSFQANLQTPRSLGDRLNDFNNRFYRDLNGYSYADPDYTWSSPFDGSIITVSQLYGYGRNYSFDGFRNRYANAEWALDAWKNYELRGNYQNALKFYKTVSDCAQTSNCSEARSAFDREFKVQFDEVIDQKWYRYVRQNDRRAYEAGRDLGVEVSRGYVADMGYYDGYTRSYSPAAYRNYDRNYVPAFNGGFNSGVAYYQGNVVISDLEVEIQPETWPYLPGTPVTVTVKKVSNAGRVNGAVDVYVDGTGLNTVKKAQVPVKAGKSTFGPLTMTWMGQVSYNVAPDQSVTAYVHAGGATRAFGFQVYWWDVVTTLGRLTGDGQKYLVEYVRQNLAREWSSGNHGGYKHDKSLVEQLVKAYNAASPAEKTAVAQFKEVFVSAFGQRPSWISGKQGDWDRAMALLNKIR